MLNNKKVFYGIIAGVVLVGGVGVMALGNAAKKPTAVTAKDSKTTSVSKASSTKNIVSELESKLNAEVTAQTNVAELEQQLASITDTTKRTELAQKLEEVKKQQVVKAEETTTSIVVAHQDQPKDERSQPVTPVEQPKPADVTVVETTKRQTQPQTQPRPVETTTTTRQTTRQTTQATTTTKHIIIGGMGNSGRTFKTMEEAEDWADVEMLKVGRGYVILPIVYSDYSEVYTVDWYR